MNTAFLTPYASMMDDLADGSERYDDAIGDKQKEGLASTTWTRASGGVRVHISILRTRTHTHIARSCCRLIMIASSDERLLLIVTSSYCSDSSAGMHEAEQYTPHACVCIHDG